MQPQKLAATAAVWLLAGSSLFGQGKPASNVLRRPGETTMFSFRTTGGKTVSLCEGPKGAYLVYRFGTAAKVELQYPAVLDASSWKKFAYAWYFRGGGLANAGHSDASLTFRNGKITYELYDMEHAEEGQDGEETYPREVGMHISNSTGIIADISGDESTARGGIMLSDRLRELATRNENSF